LSNLVFLYTDGACQGNPGPGGWASILVWNEKEKILTGFEQDTTNNRMELIAVISGLQALKKPCQVKIVTDSQYVKNAFTEGWLQSWQKKGWKNAQGQPVKNQDLWLTLCALTKTHHIQWEWVRGHSGHIWNERCDKLARMEISKNTLK
jgi:ribonuclease HI